MSETEVRRSWGRFAVFVVATAGVVASAFLACTSVYEMRTESGATAFRWFLAIELVLLAVFAAVAIRTWDVVRETTWWMTALAVAVALVPVYLVVLLVVVAGGVMLDPDASDGIFWG